MNIDFLSTSFENIQINRPKIVGAFSVDGDRKYQYGFHNLKYLNIPRYVNFNLNHGTYLDGIEYSSLHRINQMTSFIQNNHAGFVVDRRITADFVCFRGVLKMMMLARYKTEKNDSWRISAVKFKGTIYLCLIDTEDRKRKFDEMNEIEKMRERKFRQYGFKFESYVLSDHPQRMPLGKNAPVIEAEDFCVVLRKRIGNWNVLYGAEIDGIESDIEICSLEEIENATLVEVKTLRNVTNETQKMNFFKNKALMWWCQSYLVGIESILVGLRNDFGIVTEIKTVSTNELANIAEQKQLWSKSVCLDFMCHFLSRIQEDMKHVDDPNLSFTYTWSPQEIDVIKLNRVEGETFLSKEYVDFVINM